MEYIDRFMRGGCADKSQPPATQRSEMYPVNPMDWFRCIPSRVWDPRRRCSDGFGSYWVLGTTLLCFYWELVLMVKWCINRSSSPGCSVAFPRREIEVS